MRVLHLTPELPFHPGGSGGSTRQFMLLAELARRGHDVAVVAPVHPSQREGSSSLSDAGISLHAAERPRSRLRETASAIARSPALAGRLVSLPLLAWQVEVFWHALREPLRDALATTPDVVVVEHDWAARWWRALGPAIPRVLTLENLSWRYYERRADAADGAFSAALLRSQARRFKRFDAAELRNYDALLAMSELDRSQVVEMLPNVRCEVIPNGVDTNAVRVAPLGDSPTAAFVGSFAYPPNAEALAWLLRELWPRVTRSLPQARLLVAGRGVPAELATGLPDGVELLGFVDDLASVYDRARAVLCPMRSGGGTRLKVLEGLATGRPLVSTTMGAEGVTVRADVDVLLADGADAFVESTLRALTDPQLAARIGAAGRSLAESTYDWSAIGGRLEEVLAGLASSARS